MIMHFKVCLFIFVLIYDGCMLTYVYDVCMIERVCTCVYMSESV
jgi:hypothetical protein